MNVKRIKLRDKLRIIINKGHFGCKPHKGFVPEYIVDMVCLLIQNNYRRRQYHKKGYTCNNCGQMLKPGKVCTCKMKGADL